MKLYNYIEDYPGKEPVTAYRGVPFPTTQPMDASKWSNTNSTKHTPFDINQKGTWWTEGGDEPHATASFFGGMYDAPKSLVIGHRGPLDNIGQVQRRNREWNPANDSVMSEAFVAHEQPVNWDNIVISQPTSSVTNDMTDEEHYNWLLDTHKRVSGFPPRKKRLKFLGSANE